MAVTITPTANTAYDSDIMFSGTVAISGALADNSETLNVSLYYTNDGATFLGVPQTYNGTNTETTYNFANGTIMTVNQSTGAWSFQRLTSELHSTVYEYTITFTLKGTTTTSNSVTVKPTKNVTVNSFTIGMLDDLDATVTGACDVTIASITNQKIFAKVTVGDTEMIATEQAITSSSATYTFTFSDTSQMQVKLGDKTWSYTRIASAVADDVSEKYIFEINICGTALSAYVDSFVGVAPSITKFTAKPTLDTDTKVKGVLFADNIIGTTVKIDVTHNETSLAGTNKTYAENSTVTWTYSDGSSFAVNTATGDWEYSRVQADYEDLTEETYAFTISVTSRYGNDSGSTEVATTIPTATILGFSADGIIDTEPKINGVLSYMLPTVANNPTIKVDADVDGNAYTATAVTLGNTDITFSYRDGSSFFIDVSEGTFVFTRSTDDTEIVANDTYTFKCTITVNGVPVSKSLTVKSYAEMRNYDYQPAYPIQFYAGSPEAENTAWAKYIEEIKRVYRLYNENMNFYESMTRGLFKRIDDLEKAIVGSAANLIGTILPYVGDLSKIPTGWHLCDGTNGTPDLTDKFIEGVTGEEVGNFIEAGLPNITGTFWANDMSGNTYFPQYLSGAFYYVRDFGSAGIYDKDGSVNGQYGFDASKSEPIYGKSETVQPASYTVYFIMKVSDAE